MSQEAHDALPRPCTQQQGAHMRKMIMMAIAGYILKKFQSRMGQQTYSVNPPRR